MSDIFISYSHKDTEFVRDLVKPLEAEGFSVWWDHTIPPGKTWDEVIARGIREAKACIIIWTPDSVISDWVKEEATLAKEGGKYLPIQVGVDQPPMGFRRIQAADLRRWNGNAQDPQWRLLMTEIANLVGAAHPAASSAASPTAPLPGQSPPVTHVAAAHPGRRVGLMAGVSVGVAIVAAGALGWGLRHTTVPPAQQAAAAPVANVEPAPLAPASVVGLWQGWYHLDTDPPNQRTPLTGTFRADGSMMGQSAGQTSLWRWQQTGSNAQWTNGNTTYTAAVTGNHMVGTISYGQHSGNFEASR
jgi:TIR domain